MSGLKVNGVNIDKGYKIKVLIGRYVFIGEVINISEFNEIQLIDVKGQFVGFKPKDVKFIQTLSEEEYQGLKEKYNKKS